MYKEQVSGDSTNPRIQVRRGSKNAGPMHQLAGGEFGWAVDTRELYIGNGSNKKDLQLVIQKY